MVRRMTDRKTPPPLGYTPAPLEHHDVAVTFDVLARSAKEAAYIVWETLIEDLAAPGDEARVEGERTYGEFFGEEVSSIQSWAPTPIAAAVPEPADLFAWRVLRAAADATPEAPLTLTAEEKDQLDELLADNDRDVVVPDPQDADGPAIYEGPASEAHRWIPAGTYRASGTDGGAGVLRLAVSSTADDGGCSVAFTEPAHDAAALDRIFSLLDGVHPSDADRVLRAVAAVLASTGRPAADLDQLAPTADERPLLRGMLGRREDALGSTGKAESPGERPTPGVTR